MLILLLGKVAPGDGATSRVGNGEGNYSLLVVCRLMFRSMRTRAAASGARGLDGASVEELTLDGTTTVGPVHVLRSTAVV